LVGKKLRFHPFPQRSCEIIGIVANTRSEALAKPPGPEVYYCFLQVSGFTAHLVVRTDRDPRSLAGAVQRELRATDPTVAVERVKTFDQIRAESVRSQTFAMRLLSGFSLVAGAITLVGVFGVFSLSAGARQREIAIRLAVGAQRWEVLILLLRQGLVLIVAGLLSGAGLALALGKALQAFLFDVGPGDLGAFTTAAMLLATAALLAGLLPAVRASRVDPMATLRSE
jgi:putative ABC transport system permease protein